MGAMTYRDLKGDLRALAAQDLGKDLNGWENRYAQVLAPKFEVTEKEMVTLLRLTKQRHTEFELLTGEVDHDWAGWYSVFMLDYMCTQNGVCDNTTKTQIDKAEKLANMEGRSLTTPWRNKPEEEAEQAKEAKANG